MGFEADLVAHLNGSATLVALVGDRITPVVRDQGDSVPALTYQGIFDTPLTDLDGDDGDMIQKRVQFDAWARTYREARGVAEAVRLRMQTAAATFKSVPLNAGTDDYEPTTKLYRVLLEFSCWYRTS